MAHSELVFAMENKQKSNSLPELPSSNPLGDQSVCLSVCLYQEKSENGDGGHTLKLVFEIKSPRQTPVD